MVGAAVVDGPLAVGTPEEGASAAAAEVAVAEVVDLASGLS